MLGCLAVDRTPSRLCRRNRSGSRGDCDRFASFGFFACLRSGTYRNKAGNDHHRVQMTLRNTTATRSLCMVHVVILHGRVYRTPRAAALRHPFETGLRPVLAGLSRWCHRRPPKSSLDPKLPRATGGFREANRGRRFATPVGSSCAVPIKEPVYPRHRKVRSSQIWVELKRLLRRATRLFSRLLERERAHLILKGARLSQSRPRGRIFWIKLDRSYQVVGRSSGVGRSTVQR
jgi:hypothetical protein